MPIPIPDLEDRNFNELFEEARATIPVLAREWTDHNLHDPGITFVDLFAWLAEIQVYQLNRVTDANVSKFLKLLGLSRKDVQPARTLIELDGISEPITLAAGHRIVPVEDDRLKFETIEDHFLTDAKLVSVRSMIDSRNVDHTTANSTPGVFFTPFGSGQSLDDELFLGFDKPFKPLSEIHLAFMLADEMVFPAGYGPDTLQITPSAVLEWQYWTAKKKWAPLSVLEDETLQLSRSGKIRFGIPQAQGAGANGYFRFRTRIMDGYYERAPRIDRVLLNAVSVVQTRTVAREDLGNGTGRPGQTVTLSQTPVLGVWPVKMRICNGDILNWRLFVSELLTQIDARTVNPAKRFWQFLPEDLQTLICKELSFRDPLEKEVMQIMAAFNRMLEMHELYQADAFSNVRIPKELARLTETLETNISLTDLRRLNRYLFEEAFPASTVRSRPVIQVSEDGANWRAWLPVTDFQMSAPDDRHYVLNRETGTITFGNGLNGHAPSGGAAIRALFYKTSSGSAGNLLPGKRWKVADKGIEGKNVLPATGGENAETLQDAERRARREFNSQPRVVTSADYEDTAMATHGLHVARAKALPNYHPSMPGLQIPGNVTVVVVPESDDNTCRPGPGFLSTVQRYLEQFRLLTTNLHVIPPGYVEVSVTGRVHIHPNYSPSSVKKRVEDALRDFLNPLVPGGPQKQGWPFGRSVFLSEVYQLLDKVDGVDYITDLQVTAIDGRRQANGTIRISPNDLVYSGNHEIEVQIAER